MFAVTPLRSPDRRLPPIASGASRLCRTAGKAGRRLAVLGLLAAAVGLAPRMAAAEEKTLFERAIDRWMGVVALVGEPGDRHDEARDDHERHRRGGHGEYSGHRGGHEHGERAAPPAGGPPAGPRSFGGPGGGWWSRGPMPHAPHGWQPGPSPRGMMPQGPGSMRGAPGSMPPSGMSPGHPDPMQAHAELARRHAEVARKIDEILEHVRRIDAQLAGRGPRPDGDRPRPDADRPRDEGERGERPGRGRRPEAESPPRRDAENERQRLELPDDMRRMLQQKLDEGRRRMEQERMEDGRRRSLEMEERIRQLEAELERLRSERR